MLQDVSKALKTLKNNSRFKNPTVVLFLMENIYPFTLLMCLCHTLVSDLFHTWIEELC